MIFLFAGQMLSSAMSEDQLKFDCPVCGEENHCDQEILQEERETVRDCWVCCRPIVLRYENGGVRAEAE